MKRRLSHPALLAVSTILAPGLWILFVASTNPHEYLVGAVASVATLVFVTFVCRSSSEELTLRPQDLIQLWRVPWYIVSGVYEISLIALKDVLHLHSAESLYRVCGFDTSSHDPVRKARTVLAVAYTTAAPNFIVIGVDLTQSRMLFHQLQRSTVPRMTRALGAKSRGSGHE